MTTNQENNNKLLKEVLCRANKEEKQHYREIINRQIEIYKRMKQIISEREVLNERDKMNQYPAIQNDTSKAPDKTHTEIMGMSNGELHEWSGQIRNETDQYIAESKRWRDELEVWSAKNTVIFNERMKLTDEFIELEKEYENLEDKEKWLLLSIAIRSQPNLLNYIQGYQTVQ